MKRVLALILALVMLLALAACGSGDAKTSPSTEPSKAPAESPAASDAGGASSEPAASPSASGEAGTVGWGTDDVDHFARDQYRIVYIVSYYLPVNVGINNMFEKWAEYLNVKYQVQDAEKDTDKYLNYLETYTVQGIDGFILDFDPIVTDRVFEVCTELGITWIPAVNPVTDESGNYLWPAVCINAIDMGVSETEWLNENYKNYWKDADTSKLAMLAFDNTGAPDLHNRSVGAVDKFKELYPNNEVYVLDMSGLPMTGEEANSQVSAVFAAHPDVGFWWVTAPVEIYALGAVRCAESLQIDGRTLITCCDGSAIMSEWDGGYEGNCWVAAVYEAEVLYAEPIICGLVAMLDGRATPETLWPDHKQAGQSYASVVLEPNVITKENYKEYRTWAENYTAEMFA